jgi:hypothetical protein
MRFTGRLRRHCNPQRSRVRVSSRRSWPGIPLMSNQKRRGVTPACCPYPCREGASPGREHRRSSSSLAPSGRRGVRPRCWRRRCVMRDAHLREVAPITSRQRPGRLRATAWIRGLASQAVVHRGARHRLDPQLATAVGQPECRECVTAAPGAAVLLALCAPVRRGYGVARLPWTSPGIAASFSLDGLMRTLVPTRAVSGPSLQSARDPAGAQTAPHSGAAALMPPVARGAA